MNVDALIDSIAKKAEPVRDLVDYEKDGLLYCGHCNTPKQCRIPIGGTVRLVGCQCACAAREYEAEKKPALTAKNDCASKRCVLTESATRA